MPLTMQSRYFRSLVRKEVKDRDKSIAELRTGSLATSIPTMLRPRDVAMEKAVIEGVPVEWLVPRSGGKGTVIMHLHGGGFVSGSAEGHRMLTSLLAKRCRSTVVAPDYRLAPECPHPAALDDALSVYRHLLGSGQAPGKIAVSGDSAGGGLALAMMMALVEAGDPLPAAAVLMSPWVDLSLSSPTCSANAEIDAVLNVPTLRAWATDYSGILGLEHPLVSPIFGDFRGLPPMLIQVGSDEVLLDDARRTAAKATAAGVVVELRVWEGLWHCWQVLGTMVPENKATMAEVAAFLRSRFG